MQQLTSADDKIFFRRPPAVAFTVKNRIDLNVGIGIKKYEQKRYGANSQYL